jgi:hypothetical protein
VETGGLALVEAARAHDVGRALAAAGVARSAMPGGSGSTSRRDETLPPMDGTGRAGSKR